MNQQNLSIYDFIVDVIPGSIGILLTISLLPAKYSGQFGFGDLSLGSSILIIVVGYLVGHLIQAVASPIDRCVYFRFNDRYPFEEILREAENRGDWSVEKEFSENIEMFFRTNSDDAANLSGYETFQLTQSYLWNHNIGRARRFQILYTFLRSVWVILAFGAIAYITAAVAQIWGFYQLVWTPLQTLLIILGITIGSIISFSRRVKYHKIMAKSLVFDFYANVLSEGE